MKIKDKVNYVEKKFKLNFKYQEHLYLAKEDLYEIIQDCIAKLSQKEIVKLLKNNNVLFSSVDTAKDFVNNIKINLLNNNKLGFIKHSNMNKYPSADIPFDLKFYKV